MKKNALLLFLLLCLITSWQCNSPSDKKETKESLADSTAIKRSEFLKSSNGACIAALELVKLAEKSPSEELRSFAASEIPKYQKIQEDIRALAVAKNVPLSDSVEQRTIDKITAISSKKGADFDHALIRTLTIDQRRLINHCKKGQGLDDVDIKTFTSRVIPILNTQSTDLRKVKRTINNEPDRESRKRREKPA
jgi:predicted outer membrane protein